jgi:hypothetical protein
LAESDQKPADTLDIPFTETPDSSKSAKEEQKETNDKKDGKDTLKIPLDLTLELVDQSGQSAALPLSQIARLLPPLTARFTKSPMLEERFGSPSEPVLQTIEVPLARFVGTNRRFNPGKIATVRFRFDRSPAGVIILDELGFRLGR